MEKARNFRIQLTRGFLDFAEETGLVEEGRGGKEGKGGRGGATNTGGGMRELKSLVRRENHTRKIVLSVVVNNRSNNQENFQELPLHTRIYIF